MGEAVDPSECCIKVVCRVRPLNNAEKERGDSCVLNVPSDEQITLAGTQGASKTFTFDRVFRSNIDQRSVYEKAAQPIVSDVLSGFNGTIFAYGQTSSGKTHTMEGVLGDADLQGIIPRIVGDIFSHIYNMDENLEFHIKVCYYEIYMEKIRDLLDPSKTNLPIHEDKNKVPYVKGITERFVACPEEVMDVIAEGKNNRHIAVTNMNEHSSRSHSIFQIHVKQENEVTQKKLSGKLYLVDLAGSEKVSKTGAVGETLDEAKNINKSLSCLGNVIASLTESNKSHIPYRDSKLTRILQESLGGNSRTTMVICVSPASFNESETRSTLLFGQRTKTIKNVVTVNEELTAEEWKRRYEKERDKNMRLKQTLAGMAAELLKWRQGEKVSSDDQQQPLADLSIIANLSVQSSGAGTPAGGAPGGQLAPGVSPSQSLMSMFSGSNLNLAAGSSGAADGSRRVSASAGGGMSGSGGGASDEELAKLYAQMDEKDEEIATQSQLLEKVKDQMQDQERALSSSRNDNENLQSEIGRLQRELSDTKEEVRGVLSALEEVAGSIEQKNKELEDKQTEFEREATLNREKQKQVKKYEHELSGLRDELASTKARVEEMITALVKDLNASCQIIGGATVDFQQLGGSGPGGASNPAGKMEEDFTVARICVNKLKSEIKNLTSQNSTLEQARTEARDRLTESDDSLGKARLQVQQLEARVSSMEAGITDLEKEKRQLEADIDEKDDTIRHLRAAELQERSSAEKTLAEKEGKLKSADETRSNLERELESHRENHAKQVAHLRDELGEKGRALDAVRHELQSLSLAHQSATKELEMVKRDEAEKTQKLQLLQAEMARKQQAQEDLLALQETVSKELHTYHNLRRMFIEDLQARFKKLSSGNAQTDSDGIPIGSTAQKQINFLETNLDTLTKVHRQLVKDNADLRTELPKLERRLKVTGERVKHLETALRDAKEGAIKERARYQAEVEKIKEAVRQRNKKPNAGQANIVKAVRPGQQFQQPKQPAINQTPPSIRGGGGGAGGPMPASVAAPQPSMGQGAPRITTPVLPNKGLQGVEDFKRNMKKSGGGSGDKRASGAMVP
ncbi:kinesin heavy chain-like isoform X2 [Convolutriloba macropyga]|uniref:kinesin heavy chain-like isoform X2 n=1 Tax=Convolutriloba macropyga TaxID=536237 RepID=UPI003F526E8D